MAQTDNSTFNDLVTEISKGEREQMLKNMKQGKTVEGMEPNDIADDAQKEQTEDLAAKIKSLSFFKRFIFWLTATFTNSTMEGVLNKALMREIAKSVDKVGPGLIDFKRKQLGPTFYEKLAELKKAAEFLPPMSRSTRGTTVHSIWCLVRFWPRSLVMKSGPRPTPTSMPLASMSRPT